MSENRFGVAVVLILLIAPGRRSLSSAQELGKCSRAVSREVFHALKQVSDDGAKLEFHSQMTLHVHVENRIVS